MQNILPRPNGSAELNTMLNHMSAGKPITGPDLSGTDVSLSWYLTHLSRQNSILSIMHDDAQFKRITVTRPAHPRGIFKLNPDPTTRSLKFYLKFIIAPEGAGATEGAGIRPATVQEVRNFIEYTMMECFNKVSRLSGFVATSWQIQTNDPKHPLWRPTGVRHSTDPFSYPLPEITNGGVSQLSGPQMVVVFNRQVVSLERLYQEMEWIMACLFAVGQTPDQGRSFSPHGIDIFSANAGLIKDFVFLHWFYMSHNITLIRNVEVENLATVEDYQFHRGMSSILDDLASMGI